MKATSSLVLALLLLCRQVPAVAPGWPIDKAHSRLTFAGTLRTSHLAPGPDQN